MQKIEDHDQASATPPPFMWRQWLWRPWYAKAWWLGAAVFWIFVLIGPPRVAALDRWYFVVLLFHPYALFWYAGLRSVLSLLRNGAVPWATSVDEEDDDASEPESYGRDTLGFGRFDAFMRRGSYLDDPTDPLSPLNPSNQIYKWHHRKH
jgi:hypothetical protein